VNEEIENLVHSSPSDMIREEDGTAEEEEKKTSVP
jgi:hypothetical protein